MSELLITHDSMADIGLSPDDPITETKWVSGECELTGTCYQCGLPEKKVSVGSRGVKVLKCPNSNLCKTN